MNIDSRLQKKNILNVQTFFQSILKICRKSQKAHFIFQHDRNPALVYEFTCLVYASIHNLNYSWDK